jgi:hypothetical protein
MASIDYASTRNTTYRGIRGILKSRMDKGLVIVVFVMAFAFHLAVLFNLLPS